MPEEVREFYRSQLERTTQRVDTSIVLQMQRIVALTIDEIFVPLTCRTYENPKRWTLSGEIPFAEIPGSWKDVVVHSMGAQFQWADFTKDLDELTVHLAPPTRFFYWAPRAKVPIEEVLLEHPRVVLLGDPGSGKSTLIRWLVHRWAVAGRRAETGCLFPDPTAAPPAKIHDLLPVPLTLRYFAQRLSSRPGLTLAEYLRCEAWEQWSERQAAEVGDLVLSEARDGECLFLFDGLDEAIDANLRTGVVDAIETFIRGLPTCRYVVTSRVIGYETAPMTSGFGEWALEPFEPKQTQEFFHKWALAVERHEDITPLEKPADEFARRRADQRATEILQGIGIASPRAAASEPAIPADPGKRRLQDLAQNPMLCTLIGLIHHQGKRLPEDRCELYRLCLEAFIYDWEIQKRTLQIEKQTLDKFETMDVLEELAFHLHERTSDSIITLGDLRDIIQQFLEREKGFPTQAASTRAGHQINLIHGRAGLLVERGQGEFGFSHLQFQEYLAGRAITRRRSEVPGILQRHLWQTRWQEPILLAAGHRAQHSEEAATEFLEAVLATPAPESAQAGVDLESLLHHALFTAGRCLHDAKRVHFRTRERVVGNFTSLFSDPKRFYLWASAGQALQGLAAEPASRVLAGQLREAKSDAVRASAAEALGGIGGEEASRSLLLALRNDAASIVRWRALKALQWIRSTLELSDLLQALRSDTSARVRRRAAEALGAHRREQAVPGLVEALKSDPQRSVRRSAARALGVLRLTGVEEHLVRSLREDADWKVRVAAVEGLGAIGNEKVTNALLEALTSDRNRAVRGAAAEVLGSTKAQGTVGFLVKALREDPRPDAQISAAEALGALGAEPAADALVATLSGSGPDPIRRQAARALGRIGARSAAPALLNVLNGELKSDLRAAAAFALGAMGSQEAVEPLLRVLRTDPEPSVRHSAVRALWQLRPRQVAQEVSGLLATERSQKVRRAIVEVLEAAPATESAQALIQCLQSDPEAALRRRAAKALGSLRLEPAVEVLKKTLLEDPDALTRAGAAHALGVMRSIEGIGALLEALRKDPESAVRLRAVRALGVIRSTEPVKEFARMLLDEQFEELWPPIDQALREILYG